MSEPTTNTSLLSSQKGKLGSLIEKLKIDTNLYSLHDPLIDDLASNVDAQFSYLKGEIDKKQSNLTFDEIPTENSTNPVVSGGIFSKLAEKANASELHNVAKTGNYYDLENIPTSYITKDVNDLTYYYTKTEVDSEIASELGKINQFKYQVADSLPTAAESTMYTIYLIPATNGTGTEQNKDYYIEYITINKGTDSEPNYKWEMIGTTDVSISGFVTETKLQQVLDNSSYVKLPDLITELQSYVTETELDTRLDNAAYATKAYTTTELAKKQNNLTWDNTVTESSPNQVTSGTTYSAIWNAENRINQKIEDLSGDAVKTIDDIAPTNGNIALSKLSIKHISTIQAVQIASSSNYQLEISTTDHTVVTGVQTSANP